MSKHTDSVEAIEAKLVEHLVNRFLGWHLPKDFHPDGGIMFMDVYDNGTEQGGKFEPVGTNLFTADQAKEMFRFLLENEDGSSALQAQTSQQVEYNAGFRAGYEECLKNEAQQVEDAVRKLSPWLQHDATCFLYLEEGTPDQCDCGLSKALTPNHQD